MTQAKDNLAVAHLVEEIAELAAASQDAALKLLQAEMEALSAVLPGAPHKLTEVERARGESETEAGFDNMPV